MAVFSATVCVNVCWIATHSFHAVDLVGCDDGQIVVAAGTQQPNDYNKVDYLFCSLKKHVMCT